MKRLCLLLVLVGLVGSTMAALGCETTSHDRYRQMTWRRDADADALGLADDIDAGFFQAERPTHLSTWIHK